MRRQFFRYYRTQDGGIAYCVIRHNGERLVTLDAVEAAWFMGEQQESEETK